MYAGTSVRGRSSGVVLGPGPRLDWAGVVAELTAAAAGLSPGNAAEYAEIDGHGRVEPVTAGNGGQRLAPGHDAAVADIDGLDWGITAA